MTRKVFATFAHLERDESTEYKKNNNENFYHKTIKRLL